MRKILLAFQFLTIIPVKGPKDFSEQEIGSTTTVFPVVGLVEGVLISASAFIFLVFFTPEITNALLILILVILNGGLHLDGLSDTFDAISSRADTKRKLAIMKESTAGPFGVVAIVMTLLLKYVLLNAIFLHSATGTYYAVLILTPISSRWLMVSAACYGKSAKTEGLGRIFIEYTGNKELLKATSLTILMSFIISGLIFKSSLFIFYLIVALPVLYVFSFLATWFFKKHFGGMTGDSFGAIHEIGFLMFLMTGFIKDARLG
jgi:adenosylcobinamide-GDP ribazoletransferase